MARYGPWLQQDDYAVTVPTVAPVSNGPGVVNRYSYASEAVPDAVQPADQDIVDSVTAASVSEAWTTLPVISDGPIAFEVDFLGGATGPWSTTYYAQRNKSPIPWSAWAGDANFPSPPTLPPDAIGWEREDGANWASVIQAQLDVTFRDNDVDTTAEPDAATDGAWQTRIVAHGAGEFGPATGSHVPAKDSLVTWDGATDTVGGTTIATVGKLGDLVTESRSIDVTAHLQGEPHEGLLVTVLHVDLTSIPNLADLGGAGGGFRVGASLSGAAITYTFRPPRHRFIYSGKAVVPPRHLYPRSDGLGVGGTPTVYPPPSSLQRSNRTNGYW